MVSASLPSLAAHTRPHPRELTRLDTYGSSLRSKSEECTLSLIVQIPHAHVFTPAALPLPLGQYCCARATAASISRAGALLAGPDYPAANTPPTAGALPSQRRLPPALTALSATGAATARVAWSRADGDEVRCAAAALQPPAPTAHRRPVVSQDARLFSWRALRYAAGTASGAAAYARLEQTGRAAVGRESGARGARKGTHRRFLDARRTSQRAHRARPPRKSRRTLTAAARAQDAGAAVGRQPRRLWSGS